MESLSGMSLLTAWERGQGKSPVERALVLLESACPETPAEAWASLSLGQRDRQLLKLRESTFGSVLNCLMRCPKCEEQLELGLAISDLLEEAQPQEPSMEAIRVVADDFELEFRLPNSLDLLTLFTKVATTPSPHGLMERCLISARRGNESVSAADLPIEVLNAVELRMEQADPLADICLSTSCPACDHPCQGTFDIVSFFWRELDVWAARIMQEVCVLASAFGWSERDILAMSSMRRQFYLERVSG